MLRLHLIIEFERAEMGEEGEMGPDANNYLLESIIDDSIDDSMLESLQQMIEDELAVAGTPADPSDTPSQQHSQRPPPGPERADPIESTDTHALDSGLLLETPEIAYGVPLHDFTLGTSPSHSRDFEGVPSELAVPDTRDPYCMHDG